MAIISSVDYSTALSYKGMNLSAKYNNKKHKVYLKLDCDDYTLEDSINLARVSKNILMVNYQGLETNPAYLNLTQDNGIYIGRIIDFGNNITEDDIQRLISGVPSGVTPIINLPEDYKDLHFIWSISKKYPKVRFCGGNLFAIDGVKVGAIGVDILDKVEAKYDVEAYNLSGRLDALEDVDINTIEITATSKPDKAPKEKKSSSSGTKKKSNPSKSFGNIFSNFQMDIGGF